MCVSAVSVREHSVVLWLGSRYMEGRRNMYSGLYVFVMSTLFSSLCSSLCSLVWVFWPWCFVFWMNKLNLCLLTWNVRGLGQQCRCDDVLATLIDHRPAIVALQETKLDVVDASKRKLPTHLASFAFCPSTSVSGGILAAWDPSLLALSSSGEQEFSLTVRITVLADNSGIAITNVCAPTAHADKPHFLAGLVSMGDMFSCPWAIVGDFNLTQERADKNLKKFGLT